MSDTSVDGALTDARLNSPDHLFVLVHGLWGNPSHLNYLAKSVRVALPAARILVTTSNSGYHTYDGIDHCGERAASEIEAYISEAKNEGKPVKNISIVGYSLGGLIARYIVGLLYSRKTFDEIQPEVFTTFAAPNAGATKFGSVLGSCYNFIASHTTSLSGRQLFLKDNFRESGKPLLQVMAERGSVFSEGLKRFKVRALYANAVNDRTVGYWTASLSLENPFTEIEEKGLLQNYVEGYAPNVLDYDFPLKEKKYQKHESRSAFKEAVHNKFRRTIRMAPFVLILGVLFPVGLLVYLGMATVQTAASKKRIELHLEGKEKELYRYYRKLPIYLAENMQEAVEDLLEAGGEIADPAPEEKKEGVESSSSSSSSTPSLKQQPHLRPRSEFPLLPLDERSRKVVEDLNSLGWKKFPVWIHGENHSHASIVVRNGEDWGAGEGKLILRQWLYEVVGKA